jgi:hypothetical protein
MVALANYIGGCVVLTFSCILCSAAGVGGGGINVPILLLIFGYGFDTAVSLSLFIVLGNAFSQNMLNLGKSHPRFTSLPLIFWELVIILLPAQLGGSNIGSILSHILPKSVLYVLALVVLSFASIMSLKKGIIRFKEEKRVLEEKKQIEKSAVLSATPVTLERERSSNNTAETDHKGRTTNRQSDTFRVSTTSVDISDQNETVLDEIRKSSIVIEQLTHIPLSKAIKSNQPEVFLFFPFVSFFLGFFRLSFFCSSSGLDCFSYSGDEKDFSNVGMLYSCLGWK